ncbi:uncharacterized protein LOC129694828 [Leucoraja erinacea]|uniref:uncharacterized protein LOC129694828 n=1 Tax=Leucoraja erinaceus TaxID=7782 RepID=UPI0024555841|nr:uncharacterized protein LOC129694828 [Leucoraja erinacea]
MKTFMVLGATGSGKTTLINGMINYILGVEWGDNFRYKLIAEETGKSQAESQTSSITAYQLHHQEGFNIDYSLTIIDTPGFGDTRGIIRDKQITDDIREFFTSTQGIDQVNAVCFVVQAALARLTHTQKYVFDSILAIFGKDIAENIRIFVTFADGERPPILDALNVADVPCPKDESGMPMYFKFNNSAIFAQRPISENTGNLGTSGYSRREEDDNNNFAAMNWNMGANNMKKFFTALNTMEAKSLRLTREVLKERKQLEAIVEGLQIQVKAGLTKLDELRKTQQVLDQNQVNLDANKDFEYEVNVVVKERKWIPYLSNNCEQCDFTCDAPCLVAVKSLGKWCTSMDSSRNCTVCPLKCGWADHKRQFSRVVCKTKKEKKAYSELKERYEKAHGVKMTQQKVKESLEQEFDEVGGKVMELIQQLSRSRKRLNEIALRPNPLSTPAYIDLMILDEKNYANPGYMGRIEALTTVKNMAELQEKVAKNELLTEQPKEDSIRIAAKQIFSNVLNWFTL